MTAPRALLFDKDGTLFHFAKTWEVWAQAFLRRISQSEAEAAVLGAAIGFDFSNCRFLAGSVAIAGTPTEIAQHLCPLMADLTQAELLRIINSEAAGIPQQPAVPLGPLLDDLKARGVRLGVVTNDTEAVAHAHLAQAKVVSSFEFIAGYDSGYGAKPDPSPLLAFAQKVDLPPGAVAMVGDSLHDLQAARAAGMMSVGVLTGIAPASELAPHADAIFPDIGHLPAWIDSCVKTGS